MELRESAQNYLEAILMISKRQETVRATDICAYFGFSRPTVSVALKHFREAGLIHVDTNNHITLTRDGLSVANAIYERHTMLTQILVQIGVPLDIAREDACKIEHDLSTETFECLKRYFEMRNPVKE